MTRMIAKMVGPVMLLRAASILVDRQHFLTMVRGLDHEVATISFSTFPILLLLTCIFLAATPTIEASFAGLLIRLMAWGGILKASGLILFPHAMAAKAQLLTQAGFLYLVLAMCLAVGAYFTWFGYFAPVRTHRE
jgi:hypothetical protein